MNKDMSASPTRTIEVMGLEKSFGEHHALRGIDLHNV